MIPAPSWAPPPPVPPVPAGAERPFWSIMIPAYNPSDLLEVALRAVLEQDEGPGRMQIAVVDDASPDVDVAALVRRVAGDRVEYHRNPANLRLAGNWNRGIELARGRWVHLLHQDDVIFPGFYRKMAAADAAAPEVGVALCQHAFINVDGRWTDISRLERPSPGVLDDWLERLVPLQPVQCPAVVARRSVYERLGGFRADLCYVLDWEMWVRIAAAGVPWWFEPTILASYRVHDSAETARLRRADAVLDDLLHGIEVARAHVPEALRPAVGRYLLDRQRDMDLQAARQFLAEGRVPLAMDRVRRACRCDPEFRGSRYWLKFHYWALRRGLVGLLGRRPVRVPEPSPAPR